MNSAEDLRAQAHAFAAAGRWSDVEECARALLVASPDDPEANRLLGYAQRGLGEPAAAIESWLRVIAALPESVDDRLRLASLLSMAGRHSEACAHARQLVAAAPTLAPAIQLMGTSLLANGDAKQARAAFEHYLALMPADRGGWNNLGIALIDEGRYPEALAALDHALALEPRYARAHNNRAVALLRLHRFAEALNAADQALAISPRYAQAYISRGQAQSKLGQPQAALESYRAAFPLPEASVVACHVLLRELRRGAEALECAAQLYRMAPESNGAAGIYHFASQSMVAWSDYDARLQAIISGIRGGRRADNPHQFLLAADLPAEQQQCARLAGARFPAQRPLWGGERYEHKRIRVGYLSGDFFQHATAFLTAGLFEKHDRTRFELFALAYGPNPGDDPMRQRLEAAFEHFIDVDSLGAQDIAALVRELEIDILVDLKGYTTNSRMEILSHRPAPVQAHYLGYPGTLGVPFVDYLIADHSVIPAAERAYYDEHLVYMPECYQVTDDRRAVEGDAWTRASAGLPAQGLVLAAFHQVVKLNPGVFDCWMRLLRQLPGAYLWLLDRDAVVAERLVAAAAERGVERHRLVFAPPLPQSAHLGRLRLADLFLDTWPCSSHTTASDALWMGIPLVALRGRAFAARVSASILEAAGLPELITDTPADYEALVLALATDAPRLATLRARMRTQVRLSTLFDTARYCRNLEQAYTTMWQRTQQGLAPESFAVSGLQD